MLHLLSCVVLEVDGIQPRHCKLNFSSGSVSLIVEDGVCNINSEEIEGTRDLSHGELIRTHLYYHNDETVLLQWKTAGTTYVHRL